MSKQFILNSFCVTIFGAFLGYSVTHLVMEKKNSLGPEGFQEMASIQGHENQYTLTKLGSHQVYQNYFDVRIKHESISKTAEGTSVVKAVITAKKDLPAGLNYQWKLGQDVGSSAADQQGQLSEFKQGEQQEVFITVYGFNKHSQSYLSFVINGTVDGHTISKETLSSSRPEDSFEYVVQQQHALEQQEAARNSNGKVSTKSVRSKKFDLQNIVK